MLRTAVCALAVAAAALAPAAPGAAQAASRSLRAYVVAQPLTLQTGQESAFTLACREGDVATDGTWQVEARRPGATDLVSALDVIEAESFSRQGYRFRLRNTAPSGTRVRLFVSCLGGRVAGGRLRVSGRLQTHASIARPGAGRIPNVRCPAGTLAVAPGIRRTAGGPVRPVERYPALPHLSELRLRVMTLGPATVTSSARCLARRTTGRPGRARVLHAAFRAGDVRIADGRVEAFSASCRTGETAITGAFRLSETYYLGQAPAGRRRGFRLQSPRTGAPGRARLGLLCVRTRTSAAR